jgi:hypothetical protein
MTYHIEPLKPEVIRRVRRWITRSLVLSIPPEGWSNDTFVEKVRHKFPWLTKADAKRIVKMYLGD